jgi:RHS repeat-associated protein
VRKYTWGLDLAGQAGAQSSALPEALEGAGGILDTAPHRQGQVGGLLAVDDGALSVSYVYFADVQGNIGQVVDLAAGSASVSMMAKYEYDAYGNRTATAGTYSQPFGFSTKCYDAESGFVYLGHRYYSPVLGRWISRDLEDRGGYVDPYCYLSNDAVNRAAMPGVPLPAGGRPAGAVPGTPPGGSVSGSGLGVGPDGLPRPPADADCQGLAWAIGGSSKADCEGKVRVKCLDDDVGGCGKAQCIHTFPGHWVAIVFLCGGKCPRSGCASQPSTSPSQPATTSPAAASFVASFIPIFPIVTWSCDGVADEYSGDKSCTCNPHVGWPI